MDTIFRLLQQKKYDQIETYLHTLSTDEICKLLDECCHGCEENNAMREKAGMLGSILTTVLKTVFQNLSYTSTSPSECIKRRESIFQHTLLNVLQKDLSSKISSEIIGILLFQVDGLSGSVLAELASKILDILRSQTISNERQLELFPKILMSISKKDTIIYDGNETSGAECKNYFFSILCNTKWKSNIIHLTSMLRDIIMTPEEYLLAIEKLIQMIKELSLDDIPPFIYQLLLLSIKGQKRMLLEGIISFFNQKEKEIMKIIMTVPETVEDEEECSAGPNEEQLHHVEGTVIFHILCAMRRDHELAKEFIKFLKLNQQNPSIILTPFTIALGLSTTNIDRFQEPILGCFKTGVTQSYKEKQLKKSSEWIQDMIAFEYDISSVFMEVIKHSARGWDPVMEGLVEMGFILLDSNIVKIGKKTNSINSFTQLPKSQTTPVSTLGKNILFNTFKLCNAVRGTILERLLNLIVTRKNCSDIHTELLATMIKSFPLYIMENNAKIQQRLEYLRLLPFPNALGLMRALCFFLKYSIGLKDSFIITLRKAAFSSNLESRQVAAAGYLLLLKHFKILGVLPSSQSSQSSLGSQVYIDVHMKFHPETNEALCLELLGTLRRCLTQQLEIRCIIYEGLCKIISKNQNLQEPILELLYNQFLNYYEQNEDISPPVKLDSTFSVQNDQIVLNEPLAHLVHSIQFCVRKIVDQQTDGIAQSENLLTLKSFRQRMSVIDLEDFELDKSTDFTSTTTTGQKNITRAKLVLGLYESLMEFTLCGGEIRNEKVEMIQKLFNNHQKLTALIKEKSSSKKKENIKTKTNSINMDNRSLLSLDSLAEAMKLMFEISNESEENQDISEDREFNHFIISTAANNIQAIKDTGQSSAPETDHFEKYFSPFSTMAKIFLQLYSIKCKEKKMENRRSISIEAFANIITITSSFFPLKLPELLRNLETVVINEATDVANYKEESDKVEPLLQFLQKEIINMVNKNSEDSTKEILSIINIMDTLFPLIVINEQRLEQSFKWVKNLCKEQSFGQMVLIRTIMNFYFRLASVTKTSKKCLYRDIAQDCHSKLGDIDQDTEIEESSHFEIVTISSAPAISVLLIQQLGNMLNNVNWILAMMKGELNNCSLYTEQDAEYRIFKENKICSCLGMILTVLHELVQTSFPANHSIQHIVKLLTTFFNTLMIFCKYFIAVYTLKVGHLCLRFEKLVNMCGTHLTPQVYSMITHYETSKRTETKKKLTCVAEKAKILRETKCIPNLIYEIEQYERFLMRLTKKSHVNLMVNVKLSTSRDFRINMEFVQKTIENQSSDEENNQEDAEEPSTNKRRKLHSKAPMRISSNTSQ